jgi:hypothetical protein
VIKAQIVNRMPQAYFKKLMKKGWDPGYFVELEPDDYPTLATRIRFERFGMVDHGNGKKVPILNEYRTRAVVLSKGIDDTNRRIVGQGDGWVIGLWISILRRQIKQGSLDVKAWAFEVLTGLERDDAYWHTQADNWTTDLLQKNAPEA